MIDLTIHGHVHRGDLDDEQLAALTETALDLLEQHPHALGPATGANLQERLLEVRFDVAADTAADAHAQISDIARALEDAFGPLAAESRAAELAAA